MIETRVTVTRVYVHAAFGRDDAGREFSVGLGRLSPDLIPLSVGDRLGITWDPQRRLEPGQKHSAFRVKRA